MNMQIHVHRNFKNNHSPDNLIYKEIHLKDIQFKIVFRPESIVIKSQESKGLTISMNTISRANL